MYLHLKRIYSYFSCTNMPLCLETKRYMKPWRRRLKFTLYLLHYLFKVRLYGGPVIKRLALKDPYLGGPGVTGRWLRTSVVSRAHHIIGVLLGADAASSSVTPKTWRQQVMRCGCQRDKGSRNHITFTQPHNKPCGSASRVKCVAKGGRSPAMLTDETFCKTTLRRRQKIM